MLMQNVDPLNASPRRDPVDTETNTLTNSMPLCELDHTEPLLIRRCEGSITCQMMTLWELDNIARDTPQRDVN